MSIQNYRPELQSFDKNTLKTPSDGGKEVKVYGKIGAFFHKLNLFSSDKLTKIEVRDGEKVKIRKIKTSDLDRLTHPGIRDISASAGIAPRSIPREHPQPQNEAPPPNINVVAPIPQAPHSVVVEQAPPQVVIPPQAAPQAAPQAVIHPQVPQAAAPQVHQVSAEVKAIIEQSKKPRWGEPDPQVIAKAKADILNYVNQNQAQMQQSGHVVMTKYVIEGVDARQKAALLSELMLEGKLYAYSSQRNEQFTLFDSKERFEDYKEHLSPISVDILFSVEELVLGNLKYDELPIQG